LKNDNGNKSICIMGASTSTNNMGVSALAVSVVNIFKNLKPEYELSFIIGNSTSNPQKIRASHGDDILIPTVPFRLSPRSKLSSHILVLLLAGIMQKMIPGKKLRKRFIKLFPVINAIDDSDVVADIHGGDSFSDIYGLHSFIISTIPLFITIFLRKKLVLLPQTYGPFKKRISQWLAGVIIGKAQIVYSRDFEGVNGVKNIKGKLIFCPDVAFTLEPVKPEYIKIYPEITKSEKSLIGLNINGLMYNGGYTRENMFGLIVDYKKLVEELIKTILSGDKRIILVPHTYGEENNVNSDNCACDKIMGKIKSPNLHVLQRKYSQSELKYIISGFDFFIGSRMHSCIAAISTGVPTIGLAYSKKFIGVFQTVGEMCLVKDCRNATINEIKNDVSVYLKGNRENLNNKIVNRVDILKLDIFEKLQLIFDY